MAWVCQKAEGGKKQCNEKRAQYVLDGGNDKNSPDRGWCSSCCQWPVPSRTCPSVSALTKAICGCVEDAGVSVSLEGCTASPF